MDNYFYNLPNHLQEYIADINYKNLHKTLMESSKILIIYNIVPFSDHDEFGDQSCRSMYSLSINTPLENYKEYTYYKTKIVEYALFDTQNGVIHNNNIGDNMLMVTNYVRYSPESFRTDECFWMK